MYLYQVAASLLFFLFMELVVTTGCRGPTPYQPFDSSKNGGGGYEEFQIDENTFAVVFYGKYENNGENYLNRRFAELTTERGYEWFVIFHKPYEARYRISAIARMFKGTKPPNLASSFEALEVLRAQRQHGLEPIKN